MALESLLPTGFACAVTDPQRLEHDLMPSEAEVVSNARPNRKTEFAAGRRAARRAMLSLGVAPTPILAGADRAPIWPPGLIGSISHCETICIAVVAVQGNVQSVGIDIEPSTPLEDDLLNTICSDQEITRISGPNRLLHAKRIFSAKEAAFKAQYPLTQALIGFDAMDVTLDLENHAFTATFTVETGALRKGDMLSGRCAEVAGHYLNTVMIEHVD